MSNVNYNKAMQEYKQNFFLSEDKIQLIHQTYIKEFNKNYRNSMEKDPIVFITNILEFMMTNDFDPNFIRSIFNIQSSFEPITRQELDSFKKIFVTKMLNKGIN